MKNSVMTKMSANSAKAQFGKLLDTAQREPVIIEKHGRPVAVMLSTEDYNDLEALKLFRLRAEVDVGLESLNRGDFVEVGFSGMQQLADDIKAAGRKNADK